MKRKCFLCHNDVKTHIKQIWDLPGLDSREIGFSICPECGLVLQSPSVNPFEMEKYYTDTAVYQNPGRKGKPSSSKIGGVERLIQSVLVSIGKMPNSVFQVGCSDGYTLSEFRKAGAFSVAGIDPSLHSNKAAQKLYGIETTVGKFEEFDSNCQYKLIILTHVLEHLYNPKHAIVKCFSMQKSGDWVLIEAPLLERIDRFPPGYFSFEHLNYFSESTLLRLLSKTGYVPYFINKLYNVDDYPVITILARKEEVENIEVSSDFDRANSLLMDYLKHETLQWRKIEQRIKKRLRKGIETYIWGAGIHTSQLLANTDLKSYLQIKGLLDSSLTKWGKNLGNMICYSPDNVDIKKGDVILISSYASEQEIYDCLEECRKKGVIVQRLYH